jgi:hypothetical protein
MGTTARGPLPPGVYWRRRAFVGLLVVALVFVGVNLLRGGSDGSSGEAPVAQQAAEEVEPSHTVTAEPTPKATQQSGARKNQRQKQAAPSQGPTFDPEVLADPEGTCAAGDITVRPQVEDAVAGRDVTIGLSLQTQQTEACTWQLTPKRVAVKITGKAGTVWSSRECRDAVPRQEVVVRRAIATVVEMTWDARESDRGCTEYREWLLPGKFRVVAATLGGEPGGTGFDLAKPTPETVAPEPKQGEKKQGEKRQGEERQGEERQGEEQQPQQEDQQESRRTGAA